MAVDSEVDAVVTRTEEAMAVDAQAAVADMVEVDSEETAAELKRPLTWLPRTSEESSAKVVPESDRSRTIPAQESRCPVAVTPTPSPFQSEAQMMPLPEQKRSFWRSRVIRVKVAEEAAAMAVVAAAMAVVADAIKRPSNRSGFQNGL
eukprot:GHVO01062854.1.p2 GENE.GHVO01062854.1~~GHVO01062854.1.p2  ORF type:complete len:148 (+),score=32.49 GHVO01062854.1:582-1025(+)